jgi:hypothetical protein
MSPFSLLQEYFGERSHNTWSIYFVDGWMMLIPGVGILKVMVECA